MGKKQRARMARRAAEAQLSPPPVVEEVKRPWTVSRIAYTAVLWLLWGVAVTWPYWMIIYAGGAPDAALLVDPPYDRDFALVQCFGVALLLAFPLRLLLDNFAVSSGIVIMIGLAFAGFGYLIVRSDMERAESKNGVFLYTKQVKVHDFMTWRGTRGYSGVTASVDNPAVPGELVEFSGSSVPGEEGDTLCTDVFVGQLGGLWMTAPRKCAGVPNVAKVK